MHEVPILAAILSCAVPLAVLVVAFKRPLVAVWNGPLARRLRAAHWTVRAAALVAFAFLTAYGGGKGGDTNTLVSSSVEGDSMAMLDGLISIPSWYLYDPTDTDGDGIPDLWETWTHGNPLLWDSDLDRDGDGLTDLEEFTNQTDPRTADTDADGLSDYFEVLYGLDPLVRENYEGVVEPDANCNNVPDYWEGSSFEWFTDFDQDGFHDYFTLPEGTSVGGAVTITLTTTRTAAFSWSSDGYSGGILFGPCTNRIFKFWVPADCDTALSLQPPTVDAASAGVWKARMRVAWDPGNVRPFEGGRLALEDGPVLLLEPIIEGTRTYLAPASGFARTSSTSTDSPQTSVSRHSINLVEHGGYCVIHGGDPVITAVCTNVAPPLRWRLRDGDGPYVLTDQTGTVFSVSELDLDLGGYTVRCSEINPGVTYVAWAETEFSVYSCQPVITNYWGAQNRLLEHVPGTVTNFTGYPPPCEPIDSILHYVGFDHAKVRTRNLSVISQNRPPDDYLTHHCLGVIWSEGGKLNLFSLLGDNYQFCKDDIYFTSDNLTVNDDGELVYPHKSPPDMNPAVTLVTLHHAPETEEDRKFDRLWVVVNSPDTQTRFDDWYSRNADTSWTSGLPKPFASISFVMGTADPVDPEPGSPGQWGTPHSIDSFLHHDAKYEMRSNPIDGGHGHQATYDANGALIEYPIAAGTADIHAPYDEEGNPKKNTKHRNQDVYPFIRALQLDGNPVHKVGDILWIDAPTNLDRPSLYKGANTDKYVERRPVLPTGKQ